MCLSVTHSCRALELKDNTRGGEGGGKKAERLNIKVSFFPNNECLLFCSPKRKKQGTSGSRPGCRGHSGVDFFEGRGNTQAVHQAEPNDLLR